MICYILGFVIRKIQRIRRIAILGFVYVALFLHDMPEKFFKLYLRNVLPIPSKVAYHYRIY